MAAQASAWEHTYLSLGRGGVPRLLELLNDLAVDGWELGAAVPAHLSSDPGMHMIRRRVEPLPPPDGTDEGWYADPSGRFDKRFWNGRAWTFHVARAADKAVLRDPPTARTPTAGLRR